MARRRAQSSTSWTKAVISGACAAASSSDPMTYTVPAPATKLLRIEPGLLRAGKCAGRDLGIGEAGDRVAQGLPDARAGLLDDSLSLLQGSPHRRELRVAAQDGGGFGVEIVLAPTDELLEGRPGQGGREQVGGQHVDGSSFEEGMVTTAIGGVAGGGPEQGFGPPFGCLDGGAAADRVPSDSGSPS